MSTVCKGDSTISKHTSESSQLPIKETRYGYCKCGCGQRTPLAKRTSSRFGHVKGEPLHYASPGHPKHRTQQAPQEHFWKRVNKNGPVHPILKTNCWDWTGGIDGKGYGVISIGSKIDNTYQLIKAHRFSYELHYSTIPNELHCLHKCDRPCCCNPDHLWLGSRSDNMQDMHRKGRANLTTRPRGEKNTAAKLTEKQVLEIRARYVKGKGVSTFMREYGISKAAAESVVSRRTWKHI